MVTGLINGFMKVSGQYCLTFLSYDLSKFFFEELKKLSLPKLKPYFGAAKADTAWLYSGNCHLAIRPLRQ